MHREFDEQEGNGKSLPSSHTTGLLQGGLENIGEPARTSFATKTYLTTNMKSLPGALSPNSPKRGWIFNLSTNV